MIAQQDLDQEDDVPLHQADYDQLDDYYRQDVAAKKQREEAKAKILYEQKGFCKEGGEGDGY
jgi:U6 snRNA-associated Sm-like protein LSm1